MSKKSPGVRDNIESSLRAYNVSMAAYFRALGEIEGGTTDDAVPVLEDCVDRLEVAIGSCEEGLEIALDDVKSGRVYSGEEFIGGPVKKTTDSLFGELRTKIDVQTGSDPGEHVIEDLRSAVVANDPLAGYRRFVSLMSQARGGVSSLVADLKSDTSREHALSHAWTVANSFITTRNYVQTLEITNKETKL